MDFGANDPLVDDTAPPVLTPGAFDLVNPYRAPSGPQGGTPAQPPVIYAPGNDLIHQITAFTESGGHSFDKNGNLITSPKGAQGLMQVMPATARDPGFGVTPAQDNSEAERIRVGNDLLDVMTKRYGGDMQKAWAAYNAGPGTVDKALAKGGDWLARLPVETRSYVSRNMQMLAQGGIPQPTTPTPEQWGQHDSVVETWGQHDPVVAAPSGGWWDETKRLGASALAGAEHGVTSAVEGAGQIYDRLAHSPTMLGAALTAAQDFSDQGAQALTGRKATPTSMAEAAHTIVSPLTAHAASITPTNQNLAERIAGGVGGFVPALGAMAVGGPAMGAAMFGSQGYQQAYTEAKSKGASEQQAHNAALENAAIQAGIGLVPFGKGAEALAGGIEGAAGVAARASTRVGGNAAMGAGMQLGSNVVARENYDPNRSPLEGVGEAAMEAGIAGEVIHGGGKALGAAQSLVGKRGNAPAEGAPEGTPPGPPPGPPGGPIPATDAVQRYIEGQSGFGAHDEVIEPETPAAEANIKSAPTFEVGDRVRAGDDPEGAVITGFSKSGKSAYLEGRDKPVLVDNLKHDTILDPETGRPVITPERPTLPIESQTAGGETPEAAPSGVPESTNAAKPVVPEQMHDKAINVPVMQTSAIPVESRTEASASESHVPSDALHQDLVNRLTDIGLSDRVALDLADSLGGPAGRYHNGVITLAMDGPDAMGALDHEIIHAVRDSFTDPEWQALSNAARGDGALMASVEQRYPELDQEGQTEEAVADMFSRFANGERQPKGLLASAYERIKNVFAAIGNALRGQGFTTAQDVMRAIDNGKIASRITETTEPKFSRPVEEGSQEPSEKSGIVTRVLGKGADDVGRKLGSFADKAIPEPVSDILHDVEMGVNPMGAGSGRAQSSAKDFANAQRLAANQWGRVQEWLRETFTPEQRRRMWEAADEHGVMLRRGEEPGENQGLNRLNPTERQAVEELQRRADASFAEARRLGMVDSEGLESYVPRMIVEMTAAGPKVISKASPKQARKGGNLSTTTGQLRHRKYETVEETEAAARQAFGENAEVVRDIGTLALSTQRLDQAIAGRTLVEKIKAMSKDAGGGELVSEGGAPDPNTYFTIDHPALRTWRPKFTADPESGKMVPVLDQNGQPQFEAHPLWISKEFEGPLKAVLSTPSGGLARALMDLKGKMMSLIMYNPMMHNAVIWGKALPADPLGVLTFRSYRDGSALRKDPEQMREAINAGLVPIGHRFFNQDIAGIAAAEGQDMMPGRSWTAQLLAKIPGMFDPAAGEAVKRAVDKMGDVWHNTLLWDRIADLQMGLYAHIRDDALAKGADRQTAERIAAHFANRYAGALPQEALSKAASTMANLVLFSRSFTLGNIGAFKDMVAGLPSDVRAQIKRDGGAGALDKAQGIGRRKAIGMLVMDLGLQYLGLALASGAISWLSGQKYQSPLDNEQGKTNRFLIRYEPDGTAIYGRLPTGKVAEDQWDWITEPRETLLRKLSPYGRLMYQLASNDKGFGQKLYDPYDKTPTAMLKNAGRIVWAFLGGMLPLDQFRAVDDLMTQESADKSTATLQALAPLAGLTISRGAPGGPPMADIYAVREEQQFKLNEARQDINRMIRNGDIAGARTKMTDLGVQPSLQAYMIRVALNPRLRMSPKQIRSFLSAATPEQKDQFQSDVQAQAARQQGQ